MKTQTDAIYYDGKSSIRQEIKLFFDSKNESLHFVSSDEKTHIWPIKEIVFEQRPTGLYLDFGSDLIQHISIEDNNFITTLQSYRKQKGLIGWYQNLINLSSTSHWVIAIGILAIIGLCFIYVIPWIGEKSAALIPKEYDDEIGNLAWIENEYFMSIDSSKTKLLNTFAKQLNLKNTKKLKFTVVNSDQVNAFALPDGNVVVFTGIINEMKSYDELVGLLGHESSHVNNRHSIKMLCRSLSGYLFISLILGDANGVMAIIGDNVNSLQSLSFSREFEHQADFDGFDILVANKVDSRGMLNLFKRLKKHNSSINIPEFLSSHPVTEDRITFIHNRIKTNTFQIKENPKLKLLFQKIKE